MTDQTPPDDQEYIGYGNPPVETRWKSGQSGNPHGRPKKAKSYSDSVEKILSKELNLPTPEGPVTFTVFEAAYYRMALDAISNPKRAPKFIQISVALRPDLFVPAIKPEDRKLGLVVNGPLSEIDFKLLAETLERPDTEEELAAKKIDEE